MTRARTRPAPAHTVRRHGAGTGRPRDNAVTSTADEAFPRAGASAGSGASGVPGPRRPTAPPDSTPDDHGPDRPVESGDRRRRGRGKTRGSGRSTPTPPSMAPSSRRITQAEAGRDPGTAEVAGGPPAPAPTPSPACPPERASAVPAPFPVTAPGAPSTDIATGDDAVTEEVDGYGETAALPGGLVAAAQATGYVSDIGLLDDVVAAGETAYIRALADPRGPVSEKAAETAVARTREAVHTAATIERSVERQQPGEADWSFAGGVIPVLGAGPGVGTSVVAAALYDALDAHGVPTLLVDGADPARSGLAAAVEEQGNTPAATSHPNVEIRYGRRGSGWVAQLDTPPTEVLSARMIPDPIWWLPTAIAPAATVVDLGWDSWQVAAAPLRGMGAWLEVGDPHAPRPVLVVAATRPSMVQANQLLTRLQPWITTRRIARPRALVVVGATRWPKGVLGVANSALGELAERAVFLPHDPHTAVDGIGPDPVPDRLRNALTEIPAEWGLVPDTTRRGRARPRLRLLGGR